MDEALLDSARPLRWSTWPTDRADGLLDSIRVPGRNRDRARLELDLPRRCRPVKRSGTKIRPAGVEARQRQPRPWPST
jgi:hypothetical protein